MGVEETETTFSPGITEAMSVGRDGRGKCEPAVRRAELMFPPMISKEQMAVQCRAGAINRHPGPLGFSELFD